MAWFVGLLIVLIGSSGFSYQAARAVARDRRSVDQSYHVMLAIDDVVATLTEAETGQRGFLLTGTASYLAPYRTALARMPGTLATLQSLTPDSPVRTHLEDQVARKLAELAQTIDLYQQEGFTSARAVVVENGGKRTMDEIRRVTDAMSDDEQRVLDARYQAAARTERRAAVTFATTGGAGMLMLALFYRQARTSVALRARALREERTARAAAEQSYHAEQDARSQAERANRLKDEFLATVSHELRTPLSAMLGWARMLRDGRLDARDQRRGIDAIERNALAQAQLIEDLLDVSRIVSGGFRLRHEPVPPAAVVDAAIDAVRPAADARQITINATLDRTVGSLVGDQDRLQQVIWNLLSNAVKFSTNGSHVDVTLDQVGQSARITVSDTGAGIDAAFVPHVFEAFRQADSSMSRVHGGLGLGLSIARQIVEMHGGTISAHSEGPGHGATFTVVLPLGTAPAPASAREMAAVPPGILSGLRVLAVDDQEDTRKLIATVLERCGAVVQTVGTAPEALRELRHWRPDVLVSDLGMPGEDGFTLIERVRALPDDEGGRTPAIALTAYARVEDRMRALDAGFQMHVPKPVEPAALVSLVASLVASSDEHADGSR